MVIWAAGGGAVFLVVFLFFWVLASFLTGSDRLTYPVGFGALGFSLVVFFFGYFHVRRRGKTDWERMAQKVDRRPGMRLSRLSKQEYGQIGEGVIGLILAGPLWLGRLGEERARMVWAAKERASELEVLRQHLAARDGWVPLADFMRYEEGVLCLVKLEMLALRELAGEWHFHVTVRGMLSRVEAGELEC